LNRSLSIFLAGFLAGAFVATAGYAVFLGRERAERSDAVLAMTTLKLAHGLPPEHPVHQGMLQLQRKLGELSGGRMRLELYPSGQLGGETECLEQVQRGSLAMTKSRMIKTPADLKGLKIRVQNSPVAMKMVKALGGSPTPIAWGELYSALAQGTVDGAENNPPSYLSEKHCEVASYFSNDAHTRVPDILLIGAAVWDALSELEQAWLAEAAADSSRYQRRLWNEQSQSALKEAQERFAAEVYEPDQRLFMDKVQPVYDEFARGAVGELVNRIRKQAQPVPR
jgi:TRAP-type C4-dicarboxylate transport system substrate-binding protein